MKSDEAINESLAPLVTMARDASDEQIMNVVRLAYFLGAVDALGSWRDDRAQQYRDVEMMS